MEKRFFCKVLAFATLAALAVLPAGVRCQAPVLSGADVLVADSLHLLKGKRVGLVTNRTALCSDGRHLIEHLAGRKEFQLRKIFTPEHGFSGTFSAGERVEGRERIMGIPVVSLYGNQRAPRREDLYEIDILIFDMQDVGVRFYTYASTMLLCLQAAANNSVEFLVCDRPNPLAFLGARGPMLDPGLKSFVGMMPVPVLHGMTLGELAQMAVGEKWLDFRRVPKLTVVRMRGWLRAMTFSETGLTWIPPSPNIPRVETMLVYPATCYFEGTNISEGRGTDYPFALIGAPFLSADSVVTRFREYDVAGVTVIPVSFVPKRRTGAMNPKFEGQICRGVSITVTHPREYDPMRLALSLMATFFHFRSVQITKTKHFDYLVGETRLAERLQSAGAIDVILARWNRAAARFHERSRNYYLY
ncbi:MAG: DUF1343 domain-containing protein [Chlorobi bacterium]|nr:DUF1343 domain-containing protein [Chlorobiota bacterium]